MKEEEESFYVGVEDPVSMRRSLLESSKLLVKLLQRYEAAAAARQQKREQMDRVRELMKDAQGNMAQLKELLPRFKPGELPNRKQLFKKEKKAELAPQQKPAQKKPVKGINSETSRLARELSEIEKKLQELQ